MYGQVIYNIIWYTCKNKLEANLRDIIYSPCLCGRYGLTDSRAVCSSMYHNTLAILPHDAPVTVWRLYSRPAIFLSSSLEYDGLALIRPCTDSGTRSQCSRLSSPQNFVTVDTAWSSVSGVRLRSGGRVAVTQYRVKVRTCTLILESYAMSW